MEFYGFRAIARGYDKNDNVILTQTPTAVNAPERDGYVFVEWNTEEDGSGTSYNSIQDIINDAVEATDDIDIYAIYKANSYTIAFNPNIGPGQYQALWVTGTTTSVEANCGEPATLTENGFSAAGYTFIGWNTESDVSGRRFANGIDVEDLAAEGESTVTLYAMWSFSAEATGIDELNPDLDGDGFGDNLSFSTPSSVNAVMKSDGTLKFPSNAQIINLCDYDVQVSSIQVEPGNSWALISDISASANTRNLMELNISMDNGSKMSASNCQSKTSVPPIL